MTESAIFDPRKTGRMLVLFAVRELSGIVSTPSVSTVFFISEIQPPQLPAAKGYFFSFADFLP
jgi:hypothetical protein